MNSDTNAVADRAKLDAAGAARRALIAEADRDELRRRLAEVEALCEGHPARVMEYSDFIAEVRAAARGKS